MAWREHWGQRHCAVPSVQKLNTTMNLHDTLIHAVTDYDRKQWRKRGYNPHALGIYFERVEAICADMRAGAGLREAITAGFSGKLADACLRAFGLPITTDEESRGGYVYKPVALKAD